MFPQTENYQLPTIAVDTSDPVESTDTDEGISCIQVRHCADNTPPPTFAIEYTHADVQCNCAYTRSRPVPPNKDTNSKQPMFVVAADRKWRRVWSYGNQTTPYWMQFTYDAGNMVFVGERSDSKKHTMFGHHHLQYTSSHRYLSLDGSISYCYSLTPLKIPTSYELTPVASMHTCSSPLPQEPIQWCILVPVGMLAFLAGFITLGILWKFFIPSAHGLDRCDWCGAFPEVSAEDLRGEEEEPDAEYRRTEFPPSYYITAQYPPTKAEEVQE